MLKMLLQVPSSSSSPPSRRTVINSLRGSIEDLLACQTPFVLIRSPLGACNVYFKNMYGTLNQILLFLSPSFCPSCLIVFIPSCSLVHQLYPFLFSFPRATPVFYIPPLSYPPPLPVLFICIPPLILRFTFAHTFILPLCVPQPFQWKPDCFLSF